MLSFLSFYRAGSPRCYGKYVRDNRPEGWCALSFVPFSFRTNLRPFILFINFMGFHAVDEGEAHTLKKETKYPEENDEKGEHRRLKTRGRHQEIDFRGSQQQAFQLPTALSPSGPLYFFPFFAEGVTRLLLENLLLGIKRRG